LPIDTTLIATVLPRRRAVAPTASVPPSNGLAAAEARHAHVHDHFAIADDLRTMIPPAVSTRIRVACVYPWSRNERDEAARAVSALLDSPPSALKNPVAEVDAGSLARSTTRT
jgi:hypothetical protein